MGYYDVGSAEYDSILCITQGRFQSYLIQCVCFLLANAAVHGFHVGLNYKTAIVVSNLYYTINEKRLAVSCLRIPRDTEYVGPSRRKPASRKTEMAWG